MLIENYPQRREKRTQFPMKEENRRGEGERKGGNNAKIGHFSKKRALLNFQGRRSMREDLKNGRGRSISIESWIRNNRVSLL